MRKTIKIGSENTELVANAASPYLYKMIFHEDFLKKLQEQEPDLDIIQKMTFVMVKQAELSSMTALCELSKEDYLEWLIKYEPMDIFNAANDVKNLYMGQTQGTAVPKTEGD